MKKRESKYTKNGRIEEKINRLRTVGNRQSYKGIKSKEREGGR